MINGLSPHMTLASGVILALAAGVSRGVSSAALRAVAGATLLAALAVLAGLSAGDRGPMVRIDGLSLAWQLLFYLGALPAVLLHAFEDEVPPALVLGSVLGMALLAVSGNLLLLFLGLELMSLPAYVLVSRGRDRALAREAALKYFFSGGVASALFLLGVAVQYSLTRDLALAPAPGALGTAAQALMGAAALFKVGSVPLHFWLPDVYQAGAPELAGFFSTSIKSAGILLLMRVAALSPASGFAAALPALGAVSMLFGAVLALRQTSLQRLLAYSSISHAGNVVFGVGAWAAQGASPHGAAPLFFYLLAYLFLSNGAFVFLRVSGLRDWDDLRGYARVRPGLAAAFAALLFSLAGIPPSGGFLAKLLILWEGVKASLWVPLAVGGLASLLSLGYYLGLVQAMYFDKPKGEAPEPSGGASVLWTCAVAGVALGLAPWVLQRFLDLIG